MTGADKLICRAAALLVLLALTVVPAKAQFGGFDGGGGSQEDMMTQMAPMLEMMKAKMGKKRFGAMMQTMGPMMSQMMQGGGFGGSGFGGGGIPGGFGGGGFSPEGFGGGSGFNMGDMMGMIGPMMQMANFGGGGHRHHRRHR